MGRDMEKWDTYPEIWKQCIKQTAENTSLMVVKHHHLIRGSRIIALEKLISAIDHQPSSQKYFNNLFPNIELQWK